MNREIDDHRLQELVAECAKGEVKLRIGEAAKLIHEVSRQRLSAGLKVKISFGHGLTREVETWRALERGGAFEFKIERGAQAYPRATEQRFGPIATDYDAAKEALRTWRAAAAPGVHVILVD